MWLDHLQLIQGMTLGNLWKVIRRNHFQVDTRYLGHLAYLMCNGVLNSVFGPIERVRYGSRIRGSHIERSPLFVLGIWRSGTTHLHNLLSLDENLATPTAYQAFYPEHFLTTERMGSTLIDRIAPSTRPMDNVPFGSRVPMEDEVAVAALSTVSPYMKVLFPKSEDLPYSAQDPALFPHQVLEEWKRCFVLFLKKLTLADPRRLVLKSPPHLGRISLLLELFPDAQFVHIVRNPYKVFLSAIHLWHKLGAHSCLQRIDSDLLESRILQWYRDLFVLFERDRGRIPKGALHEMKFEDLQGQPMKELAALYEALKLPGFQDFERRAQGHLDSISGYRKNTYVLDEETRKKVSRAWGKAFERYGYTV